MLDGEYQCLSAELLDNIAEKLEFLDGNGDLELEYYDGVITITLKSGKQILINKHSASQQIWFSSPINGGMRFSYNNDLSKWKLENGKELLTTLSAELEEIAGIEVELGEK
ncbi:MAG: iron donor protein CyaY [Rickettsiales bacterium]